jgi:hypothetical protein
MAAAATMLLSIGRGVEFLRALGHYYLMGSVRRPAGTSGRYLAIVWAGGPFGAFSSGPD